MVTDAVVYVDDKVSPGGCVRAPLCVMTRGQPGCQGCGFFRSVHAAGYAHAWRQQGPLCCCVPGRLLPWQAAPIPWAMRLMHLHMLACACTVQPPDVIPTSALLENARDNLLVRFLAGDRTPEEVRLSGSSVALSPLCVCFAALGWRALLQGVIITPERTSEEVICATLVPCGLCCVRVGHSQRTSWRLTLPHNTCAHSTCAHTPRPHRSRRSRSLGRPRTPPPTGPRAGSACRCWCSTSRPQTCWSTCPASMR